MRVDLFDFDLPPDNIALRPASPRDSARLLAAAGPSGIEDRTVRDLPSLLRAGDMLVFNDTRVIPAQLEGRRGEARIGATLVEWDLGVIHLALDDLTVLPALIHIEGNPY